MRVPCLHAQPHTPRGPSEPPPISVKAVVIDTDDEEDDAPTTIVAAAPTRLFNGNGSSGGSSFVADVRTGKIDGSKHESAGIALPSSIDERGLEKYIAECDELFRADEPLLALRRLLLVEKLVDAAGLRPLRQRADEDYRILSILRTEEELDPMLTAMLADDWTLFSKKKEMQTETWIKMTGGGRAAVKVTGVLPHDITHMAACLLHPELYSTWIPGITFAKQLSRPANFRRTIYVRPLKVPIPFLTPRDAVLVGYGDIYSPTSAVVYLNTLEPDDPRLGDVSEELEKLSPTGSTVRMGLSGGFVFETLPGGKGTKLSAQLNLDLKLKIVPPSVIDWFIKHIASNLIPMYHKQAGKFEPGGPLESRMHEGADAKTYVELRRRLAVLKKGEKADDGEAQK